MGGKLINFYSEDLTNLLLDDILHDCVVDLQKIEQMEKQKQVTQESKELA